MQRYGTEHHRDAASQGAKAILTANSSTNPMRRWPEAKAIFEALPKEQRGSINQRFKEARLAGKAKLHAHFVISELIRLGGLA